MKIEIPAIQLSEEDKKHIAALVSAEIKNIFKEQTRPVAERWNKEKIKEYIGCGESYFYRVQNMPGFPEPAGKGRLRTWDSLEIKAFWERPRSRGAKRK